MLKIECEGTDAAGKSTGLKYFVEQARLAGLNVIETREVGNQHIPSCVKLRELVLDPKSNLCGEAMELIFGAMRLENDKWFSELGNHATLPDLVVSDRGYFSHLAYTDHNVSVDFTDSFYLGFLEELTELPDVVIYFRVSTDIAMERLRQRNTGMDVIEMKGAEYQEKVRNSFDMYIEEYKEFTDILFFEIDANQNIEGVRAQLDSILLTIKTLHL